jgi:ubiquinone/menaquinone biosynthesis C-methylase UbiE
MPEGFRPVSNTRSNSILAKIKFYGRMFVDFQLLTIFRDLKATLPRFRGKVLDVGCGQSAYRFLLNSNETAYQGIDIPDATSKFHYQNQDVKPFNGKEIPFSDTTFDGVICTEVLEHVEHYQALVDEIHRVMKNGAEGVFTVPWSARYHYIPFDFFRYTPSALHSIFSKFRDVKVSSRGTDIAVIGNKLIVLWVRNILPSRWWGCVLSPIWIIASPLLAFVVLASHIALWFGIGSSDDPLGYTIRVIK